MDNRFQNRKYVSTSEPESTAAEETVGLLGTAIVMAEEGGLIGYLGSSSSEEEASSSSSSSSSPADD
ncbi:unnamed protein product [Cochlearia groenlandica]